MDPKHSLLFLLFFISTSAFGEVTSQPSAENSITPKEKPGSCTQEQAAKNLETLKYCDQNWENWGVTEKPPKDELLSTTNCSSSTENTLNGCSQALMSLPILVGELAISGLVKLSPDDKTSLSYISQYGSLQDMQAYYTNQFLRQNCKLGSQEDDNRFLDLHCRQPSLEKIDCNPFLDQVRAAVHCRRSSETRAAYREHKTEVLAKAQKLYDDQQTRRTSEMNHRAALQNIRATCGAIMNPYSESYTKMFLNPMAFIGTAAKNYLKPSKDVVAKYNKCIDDNSKDNPRLRQELQKNGAGLVGALVGNIESLQCYRPDLQAEFKCEIAIAVLSGGTAAGVTAAKKLGRKAVNAHLARTTINTTGHAAAPVVDPSMRIPATLTPQPGP